MHVGLEDAHVSLKLSASVRSCARRFRSCARQFEVAHVSSKLCTSVRSCAQTTMFCFYRFFWEPKSVAIVKDCEIYLWEKWSIKIKTSEHMSENRIEQIWGLKRCYSREYVQTSRACPVTGFHSCHLLSLVLDICPKRRGPGTYACTHPGHHPLTGPGGALHLSLEGLQGSQRERHCWLFLAPAEQHNRRRWLRARGTVSSVASSPTAAR